MSSQKNVEIFETLPVPVAFCKMAIPTLIGQLIVLFYNMADTFFVGKTNNPYMVAAASLVLPIFNICLSLAGLTGIGGGALVSRLLGEHNYDEAKKVNSFCIYLSLLLTAVFSLSVFIFMKPLLYLLGAGSATIEFASSYAFCVIVLGGIPTVLSNVLSSMLRSTGFSKKAGFGITMGGIINMVLDPLFMFVLFPEGQEIIGAGIATFVSNCISCVYFIVVIKNLGNDSVLTMCSPKNIPSRESIKSVFDVGIPSSISTFLFDLDYIILDKLMSFYGDFALAAIGIVLKVERLPLNIGVGTCQGMLPLVGYNYSSGNIKRMKSIKNFALKFGICCAAISIVLYELFAGQIMNLFIKETQTVTLGTYFLRIRCLATPLMFISFFHLNLFNGFGEGKIALLLGVLRWAVFNIPMLFIMNALVGMQGLVWSQITADILTAVASFIVYTRFEHKNKEKFLQSK